MGDFFLLFVEQKTNIKFLHFSLCLEGRNENRKLFYFLWSVFIKCCWRCEEKLWGEMSLCVEQWGKMNEEKRKWKHNNRRFTKNYFFMSSNLSFHCMWLFFMLLLLRRRRCSNSISISFCPSLVSFNSMNIYFRFGFGPISSLSNIYFS
jgi:hypothetical protein